MLFEKPSTRTRISFEMAMHHFGGKPMYLSPFEIGLGKREATKDVARVLGRYVDAIMARVFHHRDVELLAEYSGVPVVNGLSDEEHPCQAVADILTVYEERRDLEHVTITFVGDGNNVCHSLLRAAALLGMRFRWIGPAGYEPQAPYLDWAAKLGARVELSHEFDAVAGSDYLYTDVWASMGQEEEAAERRRIFEPYRLDARVLHLAPEAGILHCLPAHRGEEITDDVIDCRRSLVFEEAENRLYGQMAVLERVLRDRLL